MELYIDLTKGQLNRAKLVQKRTMVRGKDGKVHYRMQWVRPGEEMKSPKMSHVIEHDDHDPHHAVEASKIKGQPKTRKEFIDHHLGTMSREEKYHLIKKHGVQWKRHENPNKDHMDAISALKAHLHENPHLIGAEHMPVESNEAPDGVDLVNDFVNSYKKLPELLYEMMGHFGIADEDPRITKGQPGQIEHMKNMMALKKHLVNNPKAMDEMRDHDRFGVVHQGKKPAQGHMPVTQDVGILFHGIGTADKYRLCKQLGIAERDPRNDPSKKKIDADIEHMKNMTALKKAIEKDPTLLDKPRTQPKQVDSNMSVINGLFTRASKDLKQEWMSNFDDHEHMKNRPTNPNPTIDNMRKTEAFKKILASDSSVLDEFRSDVEKEELKNYTLTNKQVEKILRKMVGLKGLGELYTEDKGREWTFGEDSFAIIQEDDNGDPVLSVVDTGKNGDEWNETILPMQEVKDFVEGKAVAELSTESESLHEKSPEEMWKALNDDFDSNYTPEVGKKLSKDVGALFDKSGGSQLVGVLAEDSSIPIEEDTMAKLLEANGVKVNYAIPDSRYMGMFSLDDNAKRFMWGDKVEKTKTKNATDYLQTDLDPWVLQESAKHWTDEERTQARKEMWHASINLDDGLSSKHGHKKQQLADHLHQATSMFPFDLVTDIMTDNSGWGIHMTEDNPDHSFHRIGQGITLGSHYLEHLTPHDKSAFIYTPPAKKVIVDGALYSKGYHNLSFAVAHEFGHAIDAFLNGNQPRGRKSNGWQGANAEKYANKYQELIPHSYNSAIERSNPGSILTPKYGPDGKLEYFQHLDEFSSNYEGRIYDPSYVSGGKVGASVMVDRNGVYRDINTSPTSAYHGTEHWAENVARMSDAHSAYKLWKQVADPKISEGKSIDDWAKRMHDRFLDWGYGDESLEGKPYGGNVLETYSLIGEKGAPIEYAGYYYHKLKEKHPELHRGIQDILLRPDFIGHKGNVKKSEPTLIIEL